MSSGEVGKVVSSNTFNLEVLRVVKVAQAQHGIRHGDYQRYRQYNARRLRRLRKGLHFTHGKNKFLKKTVEPKTVTNARFLLLVLLKAERAWSYAMQLKDELAENGRKQFHMHRKLGKAVFWAQQLVTLCNETADQRTILEAEAYASWMSGNFLLEKENWDEALSQFIKSRTIYDQMGRVGDFEYQEMCKQKVEEIEPSIRYCQYNLGKKGGATDSESIREMKAETQGLGLDLLQSKLDNVIADGLKKQAESLKEITFKGKKIPLKNEKLRLTILSSQETELELDRADSFDTKMSIYDKLFICYTDALKIIRDEIHSLSSVKFKSSKTESQEENLQTLKVYISYYKLMKTIERNLLMGESLEKRLFSRETNLAHSKEADATESTNLPKRKAKPDDLVRIYDTIIQVCLQNSITKTNKKKKKKKKNMTELKELPLGEAEESKENVARSLSYKSFRCFYMGLSYQNGNKWNEALALFNRATEELKLARSHSENCKNIPQAHLQKLEEMENLITQHKCEAHAKGFLNSITKGKEDDAEKKLEDFKPQGSLLDGIHKFDDTFARNKQLIDFPPEFEAVKCKPILFDVALGECEFPNLEERKKTSKSFWSFWR